MTPTATDTVCPYESSMATLVVPPPIGVNVKVALELAGETVATDVFALAAVKVPL